MFLIIKKNIGEVENVIFMFSDIMFLKWVYSWNNKIKNFINFVKVVFFELGKDFGIW